MANKEDLQKLLNTLRGLKAEKDKQEEEAEAEMEATKLALQAQSVEEIQKIGEEIVESNDRLLNALQSLTIEVPSVVVPDIKIPEINVPELKMPQITIPEITIPEIKLPKIEIPDIKVPEPKVTVNIPDFPEIPAPIVNIPDTMNVQGDVGLRDVNSNNPLPVVLRDVKGNPIDLSSGSSVIGNAGPRIVKVSDVLNTIQIEGTVTEGNMGTFDAFGRKRTSQPSNRLDIEFNYDGQQDIADIVLGGAGTDTHDANARHHLLENKGTDPADFAGIYTYDVPYTPGNSQLVEITGVLDFAGIGGGTAQIFKRSSVTGSVVETVVDQKNWDLPLEDRDWTKSHIFVMDFQSLKVGTIRYYLNSNGSSIQVHQINNDNVRNTGYWAIPNHPVYWRIYNDATYTYMEVGYGDTNDAIGFRYRIAKNANAQMTAICATVKSEGGQNLFDMPGFNRAIDQGVTAKTVSTTLLPLISIRPKSTFHTLPNKSLCIPIDYSLSTNNPVRLVVVHNGTLSTASWVDVDTDESVLEYDVSATELTGGHIINADYISTNKNTGASGVGLMGRALLWNRRGTETGILTLAAVRTSGTDGSVLTSVRWREIR